jgi:micrococcal nuclease
MLKIANAQGLQKSNFGERKRMKGLWLWFVARSLPLQIALELVLLVLAVLLSPILSLLAMLALIVSIIVLLIRLYRGRPLRNWVFAAVALLALSFAFSGVSDAFYGPLPQEEAVTPEKTKGSPPETTRESAAQSGEKTEPQAKEEAGQAAVKPEPESKSVPRPKPERNTAVKPQGGGEDRSSRFDATATVLRVVDGDTIEITPAIDGRSEVSLIGVDTPETIDPTEGIEPYGPEATGFATDELTSRRVGLEFDVQRVDQYGRLLAYVYADGEMYNEDLLEAGYAQTYPFSPNTKYASRFAEAQEEARAGGLGIWVLPLEQQCQLANHGNGIGEGSTGCDVVSGTTATATATVPATATASATVPAAATATATATAGAGGGALPPISEED